MSLERSVPLLSGDWQSALGDNNCAFNALILALCQAVSQGKISDANTSDGLKDLLNKASRVIGGNTVAALLSYIQVNPPAKVQKALQTVFRTFTVSDENKEMARNYRALTQHSNTIKEMIFQVFCDYKAHRTNRGSASDFYCNDDVLGNPRAERKSVTVGDKIELRYKLLPFIQEEFDRLFTENPGASYDQLSTWWVSKGFEEFRALMQKNGTWAGSMELQALVKTLGVACEIESLGRVVSKQSYGTLEIDQKNAASAVQRLVDYDFVDRDTLEWKQKAVGLTEQKIITLFSAVPESERIVLDLQRLDSGEARLDSLQAQEVIRTWSQESKDMLVERRILEAVGAGDYKFAGHGGPILHLEYLVRRIEPVPTAEQVLVIEVLKASPPKVPPCVLKLQNVGGHWMNTTFAKDPAARSKSKKQTSTAIFFNEIDYKEKMKIVLATQEESFGVQLDKAEKKTAKEGLFNIQYRDEKNNQDIYVDKNTQEKLDKQFAIELHNKLNK